MRFHDFNLNFLVYLDALISEQSVSKAAARVHITQPAMSEALGRIRAHFNDELLVNSPGRKPGRRMALTPLAQALALPVRDALLKVESIATTTSSFDPLHSDRKFSIMAPTYAVAVLMQHVIAHLSQDGPGFRIELRRMSMDGREQLKWADLDFLIAPEGAILEGLPNELLWEDVPVCMVWSENSLVGEDISLEQYLELGHAATVMEDEYISEALSRLGGIRKMEVIVPDMCLLPFAIEGTYRIATLHLGLAKRFAQCGPLRLAKPLIDFPPMPIRMQWHSHQDRDPGLVWFRNYIRQMAAQVRASLQPRDSR